MGWKLAGLCCAAVYFASGVICYAAPAKEKVMQNRLGKEKSPYLLQHKDNPVYWYAWGEEAFSAARREKKPIFLSVGYSTCYWCHVMEKDSFEREDVAEVLNRSFISIKVDREERPDVDRIYMDAVMGISGHGGWPMSVFLTPDGKPFFGATFFWRAQFIKLLESVSDAWHNRRAELENTSKKIAETLSEAAEAETVDGKSAPGIDLISQAEKQLAAAFDSANGGFGPAPKFPHSAAISLLLRACLRGGAEDSRAIVETTLDRMARGGIYDHLGGGFARYSTDAAWRVPHFEKMLYDNAQLAIAYLEGYQATGREMFAEVARETLDYLLREMTDPKGGFYSAQDAGEVGKEGAFYVWTSAEIDSALGSDERLQLKQLFNVTPGGNFEHGANVLWIDAAADWDRRSREPIATARRKLFESRTKRAAPHKDDKVLVSWNGLAISAFARGYQVLGDARYLAAAEKAAGFLEKTMLAGGRLQRRYRDGEAGIEAVLDDYSFLVQGLLDLYEAGFESHWLVLAGKIQQLQDSLLWRKDKNGYSYTSGKDKTVDEQPPSFADGAEPSGNGVAALNLLRLNKLTGDRAFEERAVAILAQALGGRTHPLANSTALIALDFYRGPSPEVAIVGTDEAAAAVFRKRFAKLFVPNRVLASGPPSGFDQSASPLLLRGKQLREGKTTYYICENHTCREPVTDLERAIELIEAEIKPQTKKAAQ